MTDGSVQNYSLEEAADRLRCKKRYLADNLDKLPHQKIGISVAFDDQELDAIREMHRVRPAQSRATEQEQPASPPTLASIKPSERARRVG